MIVLHLHQLLLEILPKIEKMGPFTLIFTPYKKKNNKEKPKHTEKQNRMTDGNVIMTRTNKMIIFFG